MEHEKTSEEEIIARLARLENRNKVFDRKVEIVMMILFVIWVVATIGSIARRGQAA